MQTMIEFTYTRIKHIRKHAPHTLTGLLVYFDYTFSQYKFKHFPDSACVKSEKPSTILFVINFASKKSKLSDEFMHYCSMNIQTHTKKQVI